MTVFENLLVAAMFGGVDGRGEANAVVRRDPRAHRPRAQGQPARRPLTLLDRKRLELARALATRPQLLLLDEIAGGLTEHEANELVALIREIKAAGMTIIWIEHVVHALVAVADRLLVINFGAKLAEGPRGGGDGDPECSAVYMGIEL